MSIFHPTRAGTRGGKDQFNWDTVKSDKDRECYLGHSLMAPTGRWQEGKDITWYAKDRERERQIKTAEFRSAKKIEEEALMAALGMKSMPPPVAPPPSTQQKPTIKREPQSTSVKNEPMTPAIHSDPRNSKRHHSNNNRDSERREDRRRRRQLKATASDEEKNEWSENDEEDLMDEVYNEENKTKQSIEQKMTTEKELDEFLIDLIKKHGLETIQRTLKSKKDKKERKHKRSAPEPSSSSSAASSESEEEEKPVKKQKHKKKHSHKEESKSIKRHRTRSLSPSSKKARSKHHRDR